MDFLSVISLTASVLYLFVGIQVIQYNKKSELSRIFFLMTFSLAIWSFGSGFLYITQDIYMASLWNKVGAFGWCTFEALVLYFVLVLIGNKNIRHWYIKLVIMMPAFTFLYMVLFLFGPDINTSPLISSIFYIGNFIYNFTYLAVSIFMIFLWGRKSKSRLHKKQSNIITICSLLPFLLNLIVQSILPAIHLSRLPNMGQLFSIIMLLGVYYAMMKYQFMSIPSSLITNELFNELTGLTLLTDSQGFIMKANKQVYKLLGHHQDDIVGNHISNIFYHDDINKAMEDCESIRERIRFADIDLTLKSGNSIPFNITIIPLFTNPKLHSGLLFVGEDIRATKQLEEEIIRHRITNEKLHSSELMFRKILEIAPISIILVSKITGLVLYMNSQAHELYGVGGADLVGSDSTKLFVNLEDRDVLIESIRKKESIINKEVQMIRKDGSRFIGLVTIIPSFYQEQEVALSCIIDMTDQKSIEEKLKQNNDYIHKLNQELVLMNSNLINKSIRDGLTNLYNHQYMNEVLEDKLKQISSRKENLCLMMLDIDHFKRVNDKFGHLIGDKVLKTVADLLMKNTREKDSIGRYGGEEFIVMLSDIALEEAALIAERIRISICDYDYGIEGLKVSISIGVVQYKGEILNTFINKADLLLYQAKAKGRNRVEK